jgi:hypothetical protein
MKKALFIFLIFAANVFVSCSKLEDKTAKSSAQLEISDVISSTSSSDIDSSRKMVITTDMKFKVENVLKATYHIEDVTRKNGGRVVFSDLKSNLNENTVTQISADSALERLNFTTQNVLKLRIPNDKLSLSLREFASEISFFDYRIIKVDDVTLDILGNNLQQNRNEKSADRVLNSGSQKVKGNMETLGLEMQENADNAKIANLLLKDKMNMSTVEINIYQNPETRIKLIAKAQEPIGYGGNLVFEVVNALKYGWSLLERLLIFVLKFWSIFSVLGLVFYCRKKLFMF